MGMETIIVPAIDLLRQSAKWGHTLMVAMRAIRTLRILVEKPTDSSREVEPWLARHNTSNALVVCAKFSANGTFQWQVERYDKFVKNNFLKRVGKRLENQYKRRQKTAGIIGFLLENLDN